MKVKELEERKGELLTNFRSFHEEYFSENPTYAPYLSYEEDSEGNATRAYIGIEDSGGNATRAYIGVEDENGNTICAGIDERLTNN